MYGIIIYCMVELCIKYKEFFMKRKILLILLCFVLIACFCGCKELQTLYTETEDDETESAAEETDADIESDAHEETEESEEPSPSPTEEPQQTEETLTLAGDFIGDQYINEALGITVTIPEGWEFATSGEIETLYGQAEDTLEDLYELEQSSEVYLFVCSKNGFTETSTLNPNISFSISNKYEEFSLIQSSYYELLFSQMKTMYNQIYSQMGATETTVTGEQSCTINDKDYMVFYITADFSGLIINQIQYFIPINEYVLLYTQTYYSKEEKAVMDAFMESIEYDF